MNHLSVNVGIIDDDEIYSLIIARQLKCVNMNVVFSEREGKRGIKALETAILLPDLIIVDIEMPLMNGHEVISYLSLNCPQMPIIAHSSLMDLDTREQVMQEGADTFVVKQLDATLLINTIKMLTNKSET